MLPFIDVWETINTIPGWLHIDDARILYYLASDLSGERSIIEVGTFCGRSAVLFALASKCRIFCIDPMIVGPDDANHMTITEDDIQRLKDNITHYPQIEWARIASSDFKPSEGWQLPAPGGMIYIDANHQYPHPKEDFLAFHRYLSPGAAVAFHDYGKTFPGVKQAIHELEEEGYLHSGRPSGSLYIATYR